MTALRALARYTAMAILASLTALSLPDTALAQAGSSGSLWLGIGAGHSDNIRRSALMPESGSFSAMGIESDLTYESHRLALDFLADLERRQYSISGIEDETYGNAELSMEIAAVPDLVSWLVLDDYAQGRVDPFEVTSPLNRAEINVFSTGPRFDIPLGMRSLLRLEALKGERAVSDIAGLDSDSLETSAAYVRVVNETTQISINISERDLDYEMAGDRFETSSAYLSYDKTLASGRAYLAIGSTKTESRVMSSSTPYLDLSWSRDVGVRSRVEINAEQRYVDFFDDYRFGGASETVLGSEVYEQQILSWIYTIEGSRNRLELRQSTAKADYINDSARDYDDITFGMSYQRELPRRMTLAARFATSKRDFAVAARDDDADRWALEIDKEFGQRLSLGMTYDSYEDVSVTGDNVAEDTVRLFFRYAVARPDSASGAVQ